MQRIHKLLLAAGLVGTIGQAHASLPAMANVSNEVELQITNEEVAEEQAINREFDVAERDGAETVKVAALGDLQIGERPAASGRCRPMHGVASWYGSGRKTANGEPFNPNGLTAAHRTLPFGTMVRVTNHRNGRSVTVRINDRGPFIGGRSIDLARGAARAIGMSGTQSVSMEACL